MRGIVFILLHPLFCSSPDGCSGLLPCGGAPQQRPPAPDAKEHDSGKFLKNGAAARGRLLLLSDILLLFRFRLAGLLSAGLFHQYHNFMHNQRRQRKDHDKQPHSACHPDCAEYFP